MYSVSMDKYFSKAPRKIGIEGVEITGFIKTIRDRLVYISTRNGTIVRLDMELKYSLINSDEKLPIDHLDMVDDNNRVFLSGMPGLTVQADTHGNLHLWSSYQDFLKK